MHTARRSNSGNGSYHFETNVLTFSPILFSPSCRAPSSYFGSLTTINSTLSESDVLDEGGAVAAGVSSCLEDLKEGEIRENFCLGYFSTGCRSRVFPVPTGAVDDGGSDMAPGKRQRFPLPETR